MQTRLGGTIVRGAAASVVLAGVTLVAVFGSLGGGAAQAAGAKPKNLPYVQWAGHETKSERKGFVLVNDEEAWRSLWAEHTGRNTDYGAMSRNEVPKVNFEQCLVLASFRGASTNSDGQSVESISVGDEAMRVRFIADTFQTSGPDGGAVKTRPFGIWVLPRTTKPIVVEEGRHGLKDEPAVFKEVWRSTAE